MIAMKSFNKWLEASKELRAIAGANSINHKTFDFMQMKSLVGRKFAYGCRGNTVVRTINGMTYDAESDKFFYKGSTEITMPNGKSHIQSFIDYDAKDVLKNVIMYGNWKEV